MKIGYLLRYYPTLTETFVHDEIAGVAARGVRPWIGALGARADGALRAGPDPAPVCRIGRPWAARLRGPRTAAARQLAAWQRPKDAARLDALRAVLGDTDLLHAHFAGENAELAWALHAEGGPPYTVTVHAVDLFKPRPSLDTVLGAASAVLTVSAYNEALLQARGISARLVRCGPAPGPGPAPPQDGPGLRLLFVGRDTPKKGLDTLLAAMALAPPGVSLTVVGPPPRPATPAVVFAGPLPAPAVRAAIAAHDAVVLPSRRAADGDQDGIPVVLMEALAQARPVLTTPVSGIPELVDDTVGWLVPPDDPAALAAAFSAAADPDARRNRGAAGPARLAARGFTLDAQVDGVITAWRSVLSALALGR